MNSQLPFVWKLDTGGNFQWVQSLAVGSLASGSDIERDGAGNLYITGTLNSLNPPRPADFDPGSSDFMMTSVGFSDAYVCKLDSGGHFVWARQMGGNDTSNADAGQGLAVDRDGNVYTVGDFAGTADFDPGPGTFTLTSAGVGQGGRDAFVSKLFQSIVVTVNPPSDSDGVIDVIENAAPNGGDGNGDGIPDSQQNEVTSIPNSVDQQYVTLAAPAGTSLAQVAAISSPSPADSPAGVEFPFGYLTFAVENVTAGSATTVTLYLPDDTLVNTYYKYGPTPDNPAPHWYEFLFDGSTGAEIFAGPDADVDPEIVILHFVDGQRGDDDLSANGQVHDPGSPAFRPNSPPVASAGGPYVITEGDAMSLSATGSYDPDLLDNLTYSWDVNGDGVFGDASGVSPTLTWAQLQALGITQGPQEISNVRVEDGHSHVVDSPQATLTINRLPPASLSGLVFSDFNDDGQVDFGERGIVGVTISLDGTDDFGNAVHLSQATDTDGAYVFLNLRPGSYTLSETQPAGYTQGINSVGTGSGSVSLDQFDLHLAAGLDALNYN